MKKEKAKKLKPHVVIFVEGDTDVVLFSRLVAYYRKASITAVHSCEIQNLRGVSRYASSKFVGKLQGEIIPKAVKKGEKVYAVCCSYDTDVFNDEESPIVDWKKIKRSILRLGIDQFCTVEVRNAIEDWLLDDLDGLCSYLNLKDVPKSIKGCDGYEKLLSLFKRSGKVYTKGLSIEDFIDAVSIEKIRNVRKEALADLEAALGVTISCG